MIMEFLGIISVLLLIIMYIIDVVAIFGIVAYLKKYKQN